MLQASPQKIDLQRLATDLALQLRHLLVLGAALAVTGKRLGAVVPLFPLPARTFAFTSQARATSASDAPSSSRRTASSLNSFLNFRRDNPMTQFSI
jgi:hypothetical protein